MTAGENDALQLFVSYLQNERRYSTNTIRAYQTDLLEARTFWQDNGDFRGWVNVTRRDVEVFLQDLAQRQLTRTTQARKMSSLRSFYRFLTRRKIVLVDPTQTITLRTREHRLPQFFYPTEVKQVIASLQGSNPLTMRNLAMLALFYTTGMR
ncbi:tyrosine recombinase XerC, partial [Lactobacillus sp. XV13L]|nr:tyrosine recombinase XerC [Lactobacillus sp. XV13L]